MAILTGGTTFSSAQQVTSANLNAMVGSAAFVAGSLGTTDDSTLEVNISGRLQAKDGGITAAKLATNSVTTAKVLAGAITADKLSTGAPSWDGTGGMTFSFTDIDSTFNIENTASSNDRFPRINIDNYYGTGASPDAGDLGCPVVFLRNARRSKASPLAVQSQIQIGSITWSGHNGTDFSQCARINVFASETFSGTEGGVTMRFFTRNDTDSGGPQERMRITEKGNLIIGGSTDVPSAILCVQSTSKGFRPPSMSTTQRNAISSPVGGLMIYNETTKKLNFYNGTAWEAVTSA